MKNISRHIGILNILNRENNSYYGNPRYRAEVNGVTFYTAVDSSYGYSITNHNGKKVEVTIGTHYNKPTLNSLKGID